MRKTQLLFFSFLFVSGGILADAISKVPTGKVFLYTKSNMDGTNEGNIAVYYRDAYEIESFKWHDGNHSATVVRALINPDTLNVRQFEAYRLKADGTKQPGAELTEVNDNELKGMIGNQALQLNVEGRAWHSYDFDFSSLAYAYRFLDDKQDGLIFDIIDIDFSGEAAQLKVFGKVQMEYAGKITRDGKSLLEFNIDGPGLDNRGGQIWFNEKTAEMYGLTIEKPDESSYNSNLMRLRMQMDANEEQWQAYKLKQLNP
ncbi:hypothetical protein P2G88_01265 [Aliiglaciecola sp. CAU 1673]|uniref:hypothetical protein n=1 Tax=Aliiglaciecola sp. CAU 1673 TaxID=3032595 RepID=UPI0023D987CC|nr:hypothetical protein [Aliiglaciecola sp. CAU 1673]MDF2176880.1 hypothetical protein [Aliiglaciecola sp. CAU 1673]